MEIFAHRGASGDHPENTLIAIERAIEFGADGIEIDVQLADGQVMVFHDRWLHRTTNGYGRLQDLSFDRLRALSVGPGQQIPTLLEVLNCIQGRCCLNVELKHKEVAGPALTTLAFACQQLQFDPQQLIISSFHHRLLAQLKQHWPQFQYAGLTASVPLDLACFAERIGCSALHMDLSCLDEELVNDAHQRGLQVRVYTVDEVDDIAHLAEMKVDGIFSNFPARAIGYLQQARQCSASISIK
ncbi:glycerophosphodiester phosphodiesterase [Echinimonas agarilytica]|uniref:Glycerophosphodiester phosphodiesterase n=1 Tax=Echinimonas agarilytica TaxID=1215918 RepID=A0AA41W446_9GAMM|nr:glycerophosphodiester phosphodiesterase family protein [Echinimonas agarilytica]MCM2678447.1 glycerophosphodiester phosphodiesterase [Echinimonas agarilytica]